MIGTVPYGHVAIVSPFSAPLPPPPLRPEWGGVGLEGGVYSAMEVQTLTLYSNNLY